MRFTVYAVDTTVSMRLHDVRANFLEIKEGVYVFKDHIHGAPVAVFPTRHYYVIKES